MTTPSLTPPNRRQRKAKIRAQARLMGCSCGKARRIMSPGVTPTIMIKRWSRRLLLRFTESMAIKRLLRGNRQMPSSTMPGRALPEIQPDLLDPRSA